MAAAPPTTRNLARPAAYVALAGNPNSGKTTVFNALTGLRHRVGNYAGVTVERKEGNLIGGGIAVLDLPGTYSLTPRSPDEEVARDALLGRYPPHPELVVVVVDASNLERNLYFASQVMDLGLPVLICLNMIDVAERAGLRVDAEALERELGVPVVPCVATRRGGVAALSARLRQAPPPPPHRRWRLPEVLEREAATLAAHLVSQRGCPERAALFLALTLLARAGDATPEPLLDEPATRALVNQALDRLEAASIDPQAATVEARYEWIAGICSRVTEQAEVPETWGDRFDRVATHRVGGFLVFFALMALMFQAVFTWAQAPMGWIEGLQGLLGAAAGHALPEGELRSLVVDGVIAGAGAVLIFLPQIMILFLFLGVLEDSGYMARAAFVMDRVMGKVGLHGKSFIPLLSSFACAIPGIMATRTIENRRDRMVTILVAPLMSCSARLPVYTLLIAGFIPGVRLWGVLSLPALVLVALYLLGLVAALTVAWILKRTVFRGEAPLFLMELPPYKVPGWRTVLLQTLERSSHFVTRAGTIILAISILMWLAMRFPGDATQSSAERLRGSLAGRAGHLLEPAVAPFGMDWKVGIGILGSFAAREVFVSTMATVYNVEDSDEERQSVSVREQMRSEVNPATGRPRFTPLSATALMVFYVLAMQCVSTLAVVRRETDSWRWPAFQWAYMTLLAWVGAVAVYQGGRLLGWE